MEKVYRDALFVHGGKPIKFPSYMMMSENLFHRVWTLVSHRRLKNVTMILDWAPNTSKLGAATHADLDGTYQPIMDGSNGSEGLSPLHCLQRAFEMLNVSGSGKLNKTDFKALLQTMEVLPSPEDDGANVEREVSQLMAELDTDKDGLLSFEDVKKMMSMQKYVKVNTNRHFVAMSLDEAEFVRALMHSMQGQSANEVVPVQDPQKTLSRKAGTIPTASLLANSDLSFGLRINGRTLLDITKGYVPPPTPMLDNTSQCYRFINSELHYHSADIGVVLRVLHDTPSVRREAFFNEVRTCRRRVQRDWKDTAVAPAISQQDEYTWLEFHAIISAIRTRIRARNMRLLDAFRAFDYTRDGVLSCSELYGGLEWLGMKVSPQDIYAIVRHIDKFKDGRIRYADWEAALKDPSLEEDDENNTKQTDFSSLEILPKQIEELYVNKADIISRQEQIHDKALHEIKVKLKDVSSWRQIWTSEGSGARQHATVWYPHIKEHMVFGRNKYRTCLGHYAVVMGQGHHISLRGAFHISKSAKAPSNLKGTTIELTDLDVSTLSKSGNLDEVHVNYLMPHPVGFKMVWWQQNTSEAGNLYIWRPIPPSDDFVSLGVVATTTNAEPQLDAVRCVNKGFLVPATMKPVKLWDNAGTGGKKGTFWIVNSLGLLAVTEGDLPPTACFELRSARFIASEGFVLSSDSNTTQPPQLPAKPALPAKPPSTTPPAIITPPMMQAPPPSLVLPPPIQPTPLQPAPMQPPLLPTPLQPTLQPAPTGRPKSNTISAPVPTTVPVIGVPPPKPASAAPTTRPPVTPPTPKPPATAPPTPTRPPPPNVPPSLPPTQPQTTTKSLPLQPPLMPTVVHTYTQPSTTTTTPTPAPVYKPAPTSLNIPPSSNAPPQATPAKKSSSFLVMSSSKPAPTPAPTPSFAAPTRAPSVTTTTPPPSVAAMKAMPSPFLQAQTTVPQQQAGPRASTTITPPFAPIRPTPAGAPPGGRALPAKPPPRP